MVNKTIKRLIHFYRTQECLWKLKSKDYTDKSKKEQAYVELQAILKKSNRNATIEDVKRKINSLRSCFRKEYKKVEDSMKTALASEDVYKPNLWYFDMLMFLKDQDIPGKNTGNEYLEIVFTKGENEEQPEEEESSSSSESSTCSFSQAQSQPPVIRPQIKQKRKKPESENEYNIVAETLQPVIPEEAEDFDIMGRYMAAKLRKLDPSMKIFAEKLINDVFFEAQLGTLNRNAFISVSAPGEQYTPSAGNNIKISPL